MRVLPQNCPKSQKKRTPRPFIERGIPMAQDGNRVAYAPFVLRSAIPKDPLADWTLCLIESVARLQHIDTRLLEEAKSYPNLIIQRRADELLSYINSNTPKEP